MTPVPSDESLLFARAVESLRMGVESLGLQFFADVWNPSDRWPEKTAEIRVRSGDLGTERRFTAADCNPGALGDILASIAYAAGVDGDSFRRARVVAATRWNEWTPERLREILAS